MMSWRVLVSLLVVLVLVLTAVGEAGKKEKKKYKKRLMSQDDLVVTFLPEQDLIASADWSGKILLLTHPELEIAVQLEGESGKKITAIELSKNRRWLAVRYKKGSVRVWNLETGELALTITDNVSAAFKLHPTKDVLVLFQPKIGITQWDLGTGLRLEPTISEVITVYWRSLEISPNGNYLWTGGNCRAESGIFDFCIFDLGDGSVVAWADDLTRPSKIHVTEEELALTDNYSELLEATGFVGRLENGEEVDGCRKLPDGLFFCCSGASVAMTVQDPSPSENQPPGKGSAGKRAMKLFGIPEAGGETMREFPGRYMWEIRGTAERRFYLINSCDLSSDGKWVLLGVNSMEVNLFSTEDLEDQRIKFPRYSWQQPVLVNSFDIP